MPRIIQSFLVWMQQHDASLIAHSSLTALFNTYLWIPQRGGENISRIPDLGGWAGWRCWTDSVAVALILLGFCISAYNRPANGHAAMTQTRFVLWVVCPVMTGAVLLTAAFATWIDRLDESGTELLRWVFFGAAIYLLARLIAALVAFPRSKDVDPFHKRVFALELIGWAASGMCTGLLVGLGADLCRRMALSAPYELATYLAVFGPPWIVSCFLCGEAIYVGVTSRLPYGERDREWLGRAGGWFGIFVVGYLVFSWLVLFGWQWVQQAGLEVRYLAAIGGSGLLSIFGALTPLTRATAASASRERLPITGIVAVLSGLFVFGASAALAQATLDLVDWQGRSLHENLGIGLNSDLHDRTFEPLPELGLVVVSCALLLLISAAISIFININLFSLHALYRNRLVKTFLGASNVKPTPEAEGRNAFDGFSEQDNLAMAQLYGRMKIGEVNLYPVLNMSLNVLATKNLAWQERKAEPFICTPFFTGSDRVGYRPSAVYASGWRGGLDNPERGISLGTAMAVSGAAVSPNWGYHSSPITSFLMMLFNVRLGWWLGNPRHQSTWRYRGPRFSWRLFLQEALGWTDDNEPWIYLSDGGHFENLGIYEMVRRRCRLIIVSDAGADPKCTLEDLGNAVRKISIDFGVRIEFQRIHMRKRADVAMTGVYCAMGEIRYPEGMIGQVIYFKPGFYGAAEPADVRAYAAANAKFPHESTLNQWFGESQFESYRCLGAYVIEEICKKMGNQPDLSQLAERVRQHLVEFEQSNMTDGATLVDIRRRPIRIANA